MEPFVCFFHLLDVCLTSSQVLAICWHLPRSCSSVPVSQICSFLCLVAGLFWLSSIVCTSVAICSPLWALPPVWWRRSPPPRIHMVRLVSILVPACGSYSESSSSVYVHRFFCWLVAACVPSTKLQHNGTITGCWASFPPVVLFQT